MWALLERFSIPNFGWLTVPPEQKYASLGWNLWESSPSPLCYTFSRANVVLLLWQKKLSAPRPSRVKLAFNFPFLTPFLAWNFGEISASDTHTLENIARRKFHQNFTPNFTTPPSPSNPCFRFPCFFRFAIFLSFLCIFPSFPRI